MKKITANFFFLFLCYFIGSRSGLAQEPEVRKAIPIAQPTSTQPPDTPVDIRIAPIASSDPSQMRDAQFAVADGFYQRKQYEIACVEFQKFLQMTTPGDPHRDQALFHLAEAERALDKSLEAQETYQQLLKESSTGDIAASASYRLGEYYHTKKELKKGIEAFSQAAQLSKNITIQNAARYQQGLCHDELGDQEKAAMLFDEISKTTDDKATRATAMMLLANEDEKLGHLEKALNSYLAISSDNSSKIAAEALVKAGMISTQLKDKQQAQQLFEKAANLKDADPWSSIAALGVMRLAYEEKDYKKVLEKSSQAIASSNIEECSQALLLTAQAERQLGHFQKALELDNRLLKEFPGSQSAHDATFMRLLLLQSLKDPSLLAQINDFILTTSDSHQKAQATLLQAETLFQQGAYAPAAKAYAMIKDSDLSSTLKADAAYKEAWSLQHLGDAISALGAYTTFLTTYPESPTASDALIQRAYLEQKQNDLNAALTDYSRFLEKYPQSPECELALQQKAFIQRTQQDKRGMVTTLQQFLAAYPKSTGAAEANYWIGWNSFEEKDYQTAIPFLEKAKQLDPKKFSEKAGVCLLLCHYYSEQVEPAIHDAAGLSSNIIPGEVARWIGLKAYERGNLDQTEQFLNRVITCNNPNLITRDVVAALAETLIKKGKYNAAKAPAGKALDLATDPVTRAAAILNLAKIEQGLGNDSKADSLAHEALLLQPEGRLNIEARFLIADLLLSQHHEEEAARAYMAISLLTEDPIMTPHALRKASEAYRRAHNDLESEKVLQELNQRFPTSPSGKS